MLYPFWPLYYTDIKPASSYVGNVFVTKKSSDSILLKSEAFDHFIDLFFAHRLTFRVLYKIGTVTHRQDSRSICRNDTDTRITIFHCGNDG